MRILNPGIFSKTFSRLMPYMLGITMLFFASGLYFSFFASPEDYYQGDAVRIMYIHVPAAWMALGIYIIMAVASFGYLVWGASLLDLIALAAAPIGTVFALICLVTGSLWGRAVWGAWWVWDVRLSSMLILFFFYLSYIVFRTSLGDGERTSKSASMLNLVGLINIPIVKFSVNLWTTLHQPASILRSNGIAIHSSMLIPLLLMFCAFLSFFVLLTILRINTLINIRKIERILAI
jgi:heme exporter protein C